jgi:hypothetical protein
MVALGDCSWEVSEGGNGQAMGILMVGAGILCVFDSSFEVQSQLGRPTFALHGSKVILASREELFNFPIY